MDKSSTSLMEKAFDSTKRKLDIQACAEEIKMCEKTIKEDMLKYINENETNIDKLRVLTAKISNIQTYEDYHETKMECFKILKVLKRSYIWLRHDKKWDQDAIERWKDYWMGNKDFVVGGSNNYLDPEQIYIDIVETILYRKGWIESLGIDFTPFNFVV